MLLLAINVLIVVVGGAILFWAVEEVRSGRATRQLAQNLLGAILVRVLPLLRGGALL